MGKFIGGIGAAFILAAAAAVIVKFLIEANIIKDKCAVIKYSKISLAVVAAGGAYVFISAFIFNSMIDRMNFFEFDKLFDFFGVKEMTNLCRDFDLKYAMVGMRMPLYPCFVNIIGTVVFNQYLLTAEFISFVSVCVSACLLYRMTAKRFTKEKSEDILLAFLSLPYAFMLFAPTYISLLLMFILCGAYALSRNNKCVFAVSAFLACMTSKLGIITFLLYPLYKFNIIGVIAGFFDKNKFFNNAAVKRIILAIFVIINGIIMFCLVRGIK